MDTNTNIPDDKPATAKAAASTGASTPPTTLRRMLAGNALILVATIFFGVNIPVSKALIPHWLSATDVTAVRIISGAVLMWIASMFVRTQSIERRDWVPIILGGAVGMFSFLFLFNMSLAYANPIDVSIIMTLPPMFVLIINVLFRHSRPSLREVIGVVVSFVGAVIVILAQGGGTKGSDQVLGLLLAVASTICYAFYLVILERPSHTYKPLTLMRWVFLFAAVPAAAIIPELTHAGIWHAAAATPWVEVGFIVLCPTFLAYFMISPAIKLIGSELVSLYQYVLPVFAMIAAVLMGIDKIHWIQIVAVIVIIVGMIITNRGKARAVRKASSTPSTSAPQSAKN